jgi:hypothetical protein
LYAAGGVHKHFNDILYAGKLALSLALEDDMNRYPYCLDSEIRRNILSIIS